MKLYSCSILPHQSQFYVMDPSSSVLRECLFSLQGISGESYVKFYEIGGDIRVRVGPNAKIGDRDALYLCGEAGCIYQRIQRTVCEYERHRNRRSISQAFAMAITDELHRYTTFLRTLAPRSLRHIVAETAPAIRSLKHLVRIADTRLTGPDLLSWLHRLEQTHVQTAFLTMLDRIQVATRRPWYDSLHAWVAQGTLHDPDFFVSAVANVNTRDLWHSGHALDRTKVPDGLLRTDREVELSYLVGKGVHFIRKVLCDMTWEAPSSFVAAKYSKSSLQQASQQVHSHILDTLRTEHHLQQHLHALKQFFLLGQGDFCASLLDGLHSSEGTIYKHTLSVLVDTALHGAVGLSDECCQRLQVGVRDHIDPDHITNFAMGPQSLPPSTAGSTVWDVLTLTYTVPDPVAAVVHPEALQTYQSMFRTLWSIRQVEHHLSVMWQQNSVLQRALHVNAQHLQVTVHTNTNYAQAIALLRQVSMVRQSMLHFVVNLQSYLQMDVLEAAWKRLGDRLETAATLDDVIAAHDTYLHVMARQSFCDDPTMDRKIQGLLGIAKRFCSYQEAVFCDALESVDRAAERRRQAEWLTDQGAWGFEQKDEEEESCFGLSDPSLLAELGSLVQVFHGEMNLLLAQLDEKLYGSSNQASEQLDAQDDLDALRSLAGQLGNNGFYSVGDL